MDMQQLAISPVHREVLDKLLCLYGDAFEHDGFAEIRVEMRILRRGQKEVILHCGKQYRYVIDCPVRPGSGEPLGRQLRHLLDHRIVVGLEPPKSNT